MERLRIAARARRRHSTGGKLLAKRLGDLRPRTVSRAQKEHACDGRRASALARGDRRWQEAGMQRLACRRNQLATPVQIERVIRVTTVGGATARGYEAAVAQPTQVIRDEVLAPASELAELSHAAVTACQIAQQLPPQRVAGQLEKARRPGIDGADHARHITSI